MLPKITGLYLILTHACNLKCKYCFVSQNKNTMDFSMAKKGIDYIVSNLDDKTKVARINFFGGEPLLRWDEVIVPSVLYAEEQYPGKVRFNMTSNCVLLTEDKIKFCLEHNIGIHTSFDGCKDTQDLNRPFHNDKGSYDIVYQNIMKYKEMGATLATMRATVHPDTCHLMFENYMQAINMGYKNIFFILDSFSTFTEEQLILYKEAVYKIANHYISYWNEYNRAPIMISNIEKFFKTVITDVSLMKQGCTIPVLNNPKKCGYGQTSFAALSPVGDIYGCQEMSSNAGSEHPFWIGHIDTGVSEERRLKLKQMFIDEGSYKGDMNCAECSARSICNGGCVANNHLYSGYLRTVSPTWCKGIRICYEIALYILYKLERNSAFNKYVTAKPVKQNKK